MTSHVSQVSDGSVTSAKGFRAGGVYAGLKTPGRTKLDLGLILSDTPCTAAATFSRNSVLSPSASLSRETIKAGGPVRAIVANSGCANCCVGAQGFTDAKEMVALAAGAAGAKPNEVLVCSTGVIGKELPMGVIREGMPKIRVSPDGGHEFARAIMTTDSRPKEYAVSVKVGGKTAIVGGCAKGAGMIHPNMATMLAFMTTDANVAQSFLRKALVDAVTVSFNQIDVDTDQSTNDTCILLANGAAGNSPLKGGDNDSHLFAEAVQSVAVHLAKEIARDGEGAKHLIEARVEGARNAQEARVFARSIVSSPLVKTAVYGRDPNWGRIMMAIGKTEIPIEESKVQIFIGDIQIVEGGIAIQYFTQSVVAALGQPEVRLRVNLNVGNGAGVAWGCDLTEGYVVENSAYTT
ncbi:MAG: bifunctional glutamate N-acetyltransferase/amino-acid acetyltransferase ArgJ [Chloroflexi bacterium]|nr:bifunctional glutamate N-acetyltransferase/amino-acid acetyltransferase ArgJ [Chloroflexota bacterium]